MSDSAIAFAVCCSSIAVASASRHHSSLPVTGRRSSLPVTVRRSSLPIIVSRSPSPIVTAEHMRWHALKSNKDGLITHPLDGEAWKAFDLMHPEFALDPRNVHLGLASDGFNPFGTLSSTYSIWPVFLTPYNLPPWMCMKHTPFILSMIIPSKHTPGNNIDVY
ncbi:hypothetical protein RIF29_14548 [Crotalaria pallida]|uniref:Uncharacterized protein n=1 Tax=Crotalaria pallida TaxID=3830 RepID=A0AAN9FBU8_CROPI